MKFHFLVDGFSLFIFEEKGASGMMLCEGGYI